MRTSALGRGSRRWAATALASACATGLAADAATAATTAVSGGASASPALAVPTIADVACQRGCVGLEAVEPGAVLRVTGVALGGASQIVFLGDAGAADDAAVRPARVGARSVEVTVPPGAATGPLLVRTRAGASDPSDDVVAIGSAADELALTGAPVADVVADLRSSPRLDAQLAARTVYYAGARSATLSVTVKGPSPVALSVALVRVPDGTVVRRWSTPPVAPGGRQAIVWDGRVGKTVPAKAARYQFQVWTAGSTPTATAAQADAPPEAADTVELRPYAFPIRGKHSYGEGAARFGSGRAGHSHEGQDVFAACGTPLVAARGGVVKFRQYHGAAGNYLVIDGDGTGQDMAYMHLRDPALPAKGDRVETGELIGYVGDTGDAHGCHLHFELWSSPGWYTGGIAIDPLAALKSWDG